MFPSFLSPTALPLTTPSTTRTTLSAIPHCPLKMTNDWPSTTAPRESLYSTTFPPSRLNKAPIITINTFPTPSVNNFTVDFREILVDESQATSIRNALPTGPDVSRRNEVEQYYKGRVMNEAPVISICGASGKEKDDDRKRSVYVGMEIIGKRLKQAEEILGEVGVEKGPEGFWVREMTRQKAPDIRLMQDKDLVSVEQIQVPLDEAGAKLILDKYRK